MSAVTLTKVFCPSCRRFVMKCDTESRFNEANCGARCGTVRRIIDENGRILVELIRRNVIH